MRTLNRKKLPRQILTQITGGNKKLGGDSRFYIRSYNVVKWFETVKLYNNGASLIRRAYIRGYTMEIAQKYILHGNRDLIWHTYMRLNVKYPNNIFLYQYRIQRVISGVKYEFGLPHKNNKTRTPTIILAVRVLWPYV